jgi:hypothetical protein
VFVRDLMMELPCGKAVVATSIELRRSENDKASASSKARTVLSSISCISSTIRRVNTTSHAQRQREQLHDALKLAKEIQAFLNNRTSCRTAGSERDELHDVSAGLC